MRPNTRKPSQGEHKITYHLILAPPDQECSPLECQIDLDEFDSLLITMCPHTQNLTAYTASKHYLPKLKTQAAPHETLSCHFVSKLKDKGHTATFPYTHPIYFLCCKAYYPSFCFHLIADSFYPSELLVRTCDRSFLSVCMIYGRILVKS